MRAMIALFNPVQRDYRQRFVSAASRLHWPAFCVALTHPDAQRRSHQCVSPSQARCGRHAASVAVIGGGAAGLTAAYFAALKLRDAGKVLVLERTREAGKKVLMSGGTRCNVLPYEIDLDKDFFTDSSRSALRAIFASWGVWECWSWLSDQDHIGIDLSLEETSNKWFPTSNSSKEIRDKLVQACERLGVEFRYNAHVSGVQGGTFGEHSTEHARWTIHLANGGSVRSHNIILATGGLSFPKVGTDGAGHRIAAKLGLNVIEPYPALTPLLGPHPGEECIAGVSLDVSASMRFGKKSIPAQRTGFLFTHKGYSGPAVLDLSHHVVRSMEEESAAGQEGSRANGGGGLDDVQQTPKAKKPRLLVQWCARTVQEWQDDLTKPIHAGTSVGTLVKRSLPTRLAVSLVQGITDPQTTCGNLTRREVSKLTEALGAYQVPVSGHQGYKLAEVTGGGVKLQEMDCRTMESTQTKSLFLCGEICDVFGRIGGFNFYWAWLSGRCAGLGAAGCDWKDCDV